MPGYNVYRRDRLDWGCNNNDQSGLSYSITDLSSNIEALTAWALLINHSKHYSNHVAYVSPTSEFIAENDKDLISKPSSLIVGYPNAYSPLWGETKTDQDLFVPRTKTTVARSGSFSVIGPSLWNRLPPSARASFLSSDLSTSLSLLKTCLFSWS